MWRVLLANNKIYTQAICKWNMLPNYPIRWVEFDLPNGKKIHMQGLEAYWYGHEDYHLFYGLFKRKILRDTENLLGKKGKQVIQISYSVRFGKLYQIKNRWGKEFRPLSIQPFPRVNKKEPKQFKIEFGSARPTNKHLWHDGVILPIASAEIY